MPITEGKDAALETLLNAAPVPGQGTEAQIDNFDQLLTRIADPRNSDQAQRAAALQLRLPDVNVDVSESGNLAFSNRRAGQDAVDPRFASTRTEIVDTSTIVDLGDGRTGVVQTTPGATLRQEAIKANAQFDTASRRVTNILNQLADIDQIEDTFARQRAVIDLGTSISLAESDRKTELLEQAGIRFNVPSLEQQLRQNEAADRAHPDWSLYQTDFDETAAVRQNLRQARADAAREAGQLEVTDNVLNQLRARKNQTLQRLEVDTQEQRQGLSGPALFSAAYSVEDQAFANELYREAHGEQQGTPEQVMTFIEGNKIVQAVLAGDDNSVLLHALTEGAQDQRLIQNGVIRLEGDLVGRERATDRISRVDDVYRRLGRAVQATPEQLRDFPVAGDPRFQALLEEQATATGITATPEQARAFRATLPQRLMRLAQQITLGQDIETALNEPMPKYTAAAQPELAPIIAQAQENNQSISWVLREALGTSPEAAAAAKGYALAHWKDQYDSRVLGRAVDTVTPFARRVDMVIQGLAPDNVSTTNAVSNLDALLEPVYRFDAALGREVVDPALDFLSSGPKLLSRAYTWLNSPDGTPFIDTAE